jgi:hypothetical protein
LTIYDSTKKHCAAAVQFVTSKKPLAAPNSAMAAKREKIRRKRFADSSKRHPCLLRLPSFSGLAKTSRQARRSP